MSLFGTTLVLLDGRSVDSSDLVFDQDTYHWFWSRSPKPGPSGRGEDVTNLITRLDKIGMVPTLDIEKENLRLSNELGTGPGTGSIPKSESTLGIFAGQILTDPLAAPVAALDSGVKTILGSYTSKLLIGLGIVYALWWWDKNQK